MLTTTLTYPSHDGTSTIHALLWEPDAAVKPDFAPRAVVQLVHGMAEHVERYVPFAEHLVGEGFVVCANDHVGHGKTASSEADLGHMPLEGGVDVLVEDVHALRELVGERYLVDAPHVIFGHSMGSFVTRVYLTRHAEGLRRGRALRDRPAATCPGGCRQGADARDGVSSRRSAT